MACQAPLLAAMTMWKPILGERKGASYISSSTCPRQGSPSTTLFFMTFTLMYYQLPSILHSPPDVQWVTSLPRSITLLFSCFMFLACSLSTSACHICCFTPLSPILSFLNYLSLALMLPILSSCMMCSSWVQTASGCIVTSTVP